MLDYSLISMMCYTPYFSKLLGCCCENYVVKSPMPQTPTLSTAGVSINYLAEEKESAARNNYQY